MPTKCGYAALIGKPNVGKSTLLNAILGTKLSIVTPKPQTTRKRILGIYSEEAIQIIFFDTPGILNPKYELQKKMTGYVEESVANADIIVVIIDIEDYLHNREFLPAAFLDKLKTIKKDCIIVINKVDLLKNIKELLPIIQEFNKIRFFKEIIPISALKNSNVDDLVKSIGKYLPESDFMYDPDQLSTLTERFFVSEIIREHIFTSYKQEIPYSTEVQIQEFDEREIGKWHISADIIIERDSQKGIVIGEKGSKLKSIGEKARKDIEEHLGEQVYLELFVKVREKWRNNKNMLKGMGY